MNCGGMPVLKQHSPVVRWVSLAFCLAGIFSTFVPAGAATQTWDEARAQLRRGDYDKAIAAAQGRVEGRRGSSDWRILLVESLMTVGRYGEAYTNAMEGLSVSSPGLQMLLLAREAALYQNDLASANRLLEEIKALLQQPLVAPASGREIVAIGQALLLFGVEPRLVLDNCFRRAEKMDPPCREAFLAAGRLGLDKHDFALAADAFRAGLTLFPDDPDLQAGLAQAFEPSNREEMMKALQAALKVNPRHIPSLLLLADHLIDAEQYEAVEQQLALVLKVNPHQPEALAYRAVLAHLRNDTEAEAQFRAAALGPWKTNPLVDSLIGRKLSQKYRFAEGAAGQRRALAFEPDYLPARRQLASDLLRLGQTDEGWRLAHEVHQADAYDVGAYNLVTLHDHMQKFAALTNADFIVRMSALEAQLYGDRVLELLARAKDTLCPKYGVELDRPTGVEIFPEQKDFAVRTFGMPGNPGYLGVCFGSVITANSPASQRPHPANWKDVLWHEFTHVVTLNATKNRMPRWLSEGISVYEERQANPTWGQRMNLAHRDAILDGKLTPLGELSGAFLSPTNNQQLQFAYYESSLAVEFLADRFGAGALRQILNDLRHGTNINEAIAARTAPMPELETDFAAFARDRAQKLAPDADLARPPDRRARVEYSLWEKLHADNYRVKLERARDLMEARRWSEAKPLLESLAGSYHGESGADNPLWLLAVTRRQLNETNAELAALKKFAEQESGFVDLFVRLIELSLARQDWPAAMDYAERLLAVNPLISLPYRALAEGGVASGRNDLAITAWRKLLLLDPPDPATVHFQLARLLHARGDCAGEARRHVLQALEDAPRFRDAHRLLLEMAADSSRNQPAPGTVR
jgi:hypothetical protein